MKKFTQAARRNSSWWPVVGITVLAGALRFYNLGARSLWLDEAFSHWMAGHSAAQIPRIVAHGDSHPPLYYLFLHYWLVFGRGEGAMRSLSALLGTLVIPLLYILGRTIGGPRLGIVAALLLAISPYNLDYSQQARMYALVMFGATMAMVGLAWLVRRPHAAAWPLHSSTLREKTPRLFMQVFGRARRRIYAAWLAYVVGAAVVVWSLYPAVFLVIGLNVVVICNKTFRGLRSGFWRNWVLAQLAVIVLCIPLVPVLLTQNSFVGPTLTRAASWIPKANPRTLMEAYTSFFAIPMGLSRVVRIPLEILWLALCVLGLYAWRRQPRWMGFVLGIGLTPVLGEAIVSLSHPIFLVRTFMYVTIPLYLAVANGVLQLRPYTWRILALVLIVVVNVVSDGQYYWRTPEREAWQGAAEYVVHRADPAQLVVLEPRFVQLPFDYYARRFGLSAGEYGVPRDAIGNPLSREEVARTLALATRSHRYVWLVFAHSQRSEVPEILGHLGKLVDRRRFDGDIQVSLYEIMP